MRQKVSNAVNVFLSVMIPASLIILFIFYNKAIGKTDLVILTDFNYLMDHLKELLKNEYFMLGACIFAAMFLGAPCWWINALFGVFLLEQIERESFRKRCIGMLVYNCIVMLLIFAAAGGMICFGSKCKADYFVYAAFAVILTVGLSCYYFAYYVNKILEYKKFEEMREQERIAAEKVAAAERAQAAAASMVLAQRNITFLVKVLGDKRNVTTKAYFQNEDRTTQDVETVYVTDDTDLSNAQKVYEDKYVEYYVRAKNRNE